MPLIVAVEVLEEVIAGQIATTFDHASEATIGQGDGVVDAALATKLEVDCRALDRDVAVAQRRQAERVVGDGVLAIADPDEGAIEQLDDGGQDLLARQAGQAQIGVGALADTRQRSSRQWGW